MYQGNMASSDNSKIRSVTRLITSSEDAQRIFKFVCVGLLNTFIGYGAFFIFSFFLNYLVALVVAHFIGVTNSYLWNKYWTFQVKKFRLAELVKFNVVYLVALGANMLILYIAVERLAVDPRLGQLVVLPLVTLLSYFGHKHWSFQGAKPASNDETLRSER
jgi:putative flippase GtrA